MDISVSRAHAEIRKIGEEYYLVDSKSKFGTLVFSKRPLKVTTTKPLVLQAGRTLMRAVLIIPCYSCSR